MSKLYSGAEIVFKCLEDQDVEFIFGILEEQYCLYMMN